MDVTPTDSMFLAMTNLTDAVCGEEPSRMLVGPGAQATRAKRLMMMGILHQLVALSMREGVNRAVIEAKKRRDEAYAAPSDKEDKDAAGRARDDAHAGVSLVRLPN